ncbi:Sir2 silent information regulator family NAD-dependent deacetylase [Breznakiella homolactica]|uniref:Sir2 silent information regulator family NAD-dependent deacetylase n=1 Tax=Breznakiella homolactica TaxID=2798577 RepID=A0A7T7XRZ0_9SPIR|nr:Sir2 silent information regulator family NAD-dependent deacetylase [Breznakiella homolactica]
MGTTPEDLAVQIKAAEAILVGAGAGLSTSAGFTYDGSRFTDHFGDMIDKYGFTDMYTAGFYPFKTPEEFWAYWSRMILVNRYETPVGKPYQDLLRLLEGREFFVLTTNVDHQFRKAGFPKARLFYTQGDYGLFQCSVPCHDTTYDNEEAVRRMAGEQRDMKIPSALIPQCPVCGKPMATNLRSDDTFVQDEGWQAASGRYAAFQEKHLRGRVLYLELGVGGNTPGIIKYNFWRRVHDNKEAVYACVNLNEAYAPAEIADRSVCVSGDIGGILAGMLEMKQR